MNSKLWYPIRNWPTWWATPEGEEPVSRTAGICVGASMHNFPVKGQVWLDFGYPTCAWSIFDFLDWVDPNPNSGIWTWKNLWKRFNDGGFSCSSEEYGNSHDNDVPLFEFTALQWWDWSYDILPFVCSTDPKDVPKDQAYRPPQAKFCNVAVDPKCYLGCEPGPKKPDCLPNANYVEPGVIKTPVAESPVKA